MRKKIILVLTILVGIGFIGLAQNPVHHVTGFVQDQWGEPVPGALVTSVENPEIKTFTDVKGGFEISLMETENFRITGSDNSYLVVKPDFEKPMSIIMGQSSQAVHIGYDKTFNLEESTSSVFSAYSKNLHNPSARDIGSTLYGNILGLTALQGAGNYADYENTFYVRGLQTLTNSDNNPLILVDGIERNLTFVVPEEVESVTVLKDAAAVALYGYKGANGAINIVTKRGKYETREVKFNYDYSYNQMLRTPEFVNSFTYANAMNEALVNDGQSPRYSASELQALQTGNYPYLYSNVNWIGETFKDASSTQTFNVSFRGGGKTFRYYTLLNLQNNDGYIKHPDMNDGYSTQNKYSKANVRSNLDIELSPRTKLELKLLGTLAEMSRPGDATNLWNLVYTVPSAAFPIMTEDGMWGGNSTWDGTNNPVAQSQAAGYSKSHKRSLFADMTLRQDLTFLVEGLGGSIKFAYDNVATYWEDHFKQYVYGSDAVTEWLNGVPNLENLNRYKGGTDTGLASGSDLTAWNRVFNFAGTIYHTGAWGEHTLFSQAKWDYEYRNTNGIDNTWNRQNLSLFGHYGYKSRYFADLSLVASAANKLAPDSRWAFSPTISAGWVISKEEFMNDVKFIDFMKLRGSFGMINRDIIPAESYWEQIYTGGSNYFFDTSYGSDGLSPWQLGRLASMNPTHEKGLKYNIGLDATLFSGLNVTLDGYYQKRKDIWVESNGKYSSVLGFDAPYENGGIVNSWGFESGLDYIRKTGDFTINAGANFAVTKSEIIEQYEEQRLYENLVRTGKPVGQLFGMTAVGFFKDQNDIDNSVPHLFSEVKPGDIKYKDVNGDGQVDANDVSAIGNSNVIPEIYYSFKLGFDWKGLGFNALFQGAGNYSAMLNTRSFYWPLINNTNISQHYYDNRWTPENMNAKYPALSSQSNNNNFQNNTVWLEDRSFLKLRHVEIYYNISEALMNRVSFMNHAKLYVRGVDLLCFDKIKTADPESYGVNNPLNKSIIAGLTLTF